jgi:hypothetical protein
MELEVIREIEFRGIEKLSIENKKSFIYGDLKKHSRWYFYLSFFKSSRN